MSVLRPDLPLAGQPAPAGAANLERDKRLHFVFLRARLHELCGGALIADVPPVIDAETLCEIMETMVAELFAEARERLGPVVADECVTSALLQDVMALRGRQAMQLSNRGTVAVTGAGHAPVAR